MRGERRREGPGAPQGEPGRRPGRPPLNRDPRGGRPAEAGRSVSRSGLPLPPVPAPQRSSSHLSAPVPAGQLTPSGRVLSAPVGAGQLSASGRVLSAPLPGHHPSAPLPGQHPSAPLPGGPLSAPWNPGPAAAGRPDVRVPVPRPEQPAGAPSGYGDWTRPSRNEGPRRAPIAPEHDDEVPPARALRNPGTTMIPERNVSGRRERGAGERGPGERVPGAGRDGDPARRTPARDEQGTRGPGTGPVGGRAALRAERQAAEMARRKAAKRTGTPLPSPLDTEDEPTGRKPRRVVLALVAMAVIALGVLGVYNFASPDTEEAGAQEPSGTSAPAGGADGTASLPPLEPSAPPVEPAPTTPVRAPVTVLNATDINGLAAKIAETVVAGGWQSPGVGAYTASDVAATTVFFTEGDETQRQAAVQLVDQFPNLQGPAPRFFEVPDVAAPGLVIVATGDWQP